MEELGILMRKHLFILLFILITSACFAGQVFNPFTNKFDMVPTFEETDGNPSLPAVLKVKTPNGGITDNGDGSISLNFSSGSGTPGGSNTQLQYNNSNSFGGVSLATFDGTDLTLTTPILTLKNTASSHPTANGLVGYDYTAKFLEIGNGSTTTTFVPIGTKTNSRLCQYNSSTKSIDCDQLLTAYLFLDILGDIQFADGTGNPTNDTAGAFNYDSTIDTLSIGENGTSGVYKIYHEDGVTDHTMSLQSASLTSNQVATFKDETGNICTTGSVCSGYENALTFSTGLTRATNTITSNLSTGISGGQSVIGGTAASNSLTLSSTTNATKGKILVGTSAYDEVNNRLGIANSSPTVPFSVNSGETCKIDTSGNVTGRTFTSTVSTGTAPLAVSSTTQVSNLNVSLLGGLASTDFGILASQNVWIADNYFDADTFGNYPLNIISNSNNGQIQWLDGIGGAQLAAAGQDPNRAGFYIDATGKCAVTVDTIDAMRFFSTENDFYNLSTFTGSGTSQAAMRINPDTAPTAPSSGDLWNDSTQKSYIHYPNAIKEVMPGVIFTQTASKTVTNTVTETSIVGTGVGTLTLPANFFVAGKTIRLRIGGIYSTPVAATPSVLIKVKYGSTVIATVTTTGLLSGATNLEFDGEVLITCRTTGSSGTVMTHGDIQYATGVAGTIAVDPLNNAGATTTINTTTSNLLDVTVTWDTATTSRIVTSIVSTGEVLN